MKISADNMRAVVDLDVKLSPSWVGDRCSKEVEVSATLSSSRANASLSFSGWLTDDNPDEIKTFLIATARLYGYRTGEANLRLSGLGRANADSQTIEITLFSPESPGHFGISLRLFGEPHHISATSRRYGAFESFYVQPAAIARLQADLGAIYDASGIDLQAKTR
jgi:hypothetical protein